MKSTKKHLSIIGAVIITQWYSVATWAQSTFVPEDRLDNLESAVAYIWGAVVLVLTLIGAVMVYKPAMSFFNDQNEEALRQMKSIIAGYVVIAILPSVALGAYYLIAN